MHKWISVFLSVLVVFSVFTLTSFASEDSNLSAYITIVSDDTDPPVGATIASGALTNRTLLTGNRFKYTFIRNISFTAPASSYIYISFDIVANNAIYSLDNIDTTFLGYCFLSESAINDPANISISPSDCRIFDINVQSYYPVPDSYYRFVHFDCLVRNSSDSESDVTINFSNPISITASKFTIEGETKYHDLRIDRATVVSSFDLNGIISYIDNYYAYWQNEYFDTWTSYLDLLTNTYIKNLWQRYYQTSTYQSLVLSYNNDGIGTWSTQTSTYPFMINYFTRSVERYLAHQTDWENKAAQAGGTDAYDSLNDSASFGSLIDFAGAGSAGSWSSSSFIGGLSDVWGWFTIDNKNAIDSVSPHRDEIYISIFDDTINDYLSLLGGD